jgi:small subunit ribosomal protein S27e
MSRFLRVKCECSNEQNIFGNATTKVKCSVCGKLLAEPRGARALVHGKILSVL